MQLIMEECESVIENLSYRRLNYINKQEIDNYLFHNVQVKELHF